MSYIANFYRQDFLTKGYTIQAVGAFNDDRGDIHYDRTAFSSGRPWSAASRQHNVKGGLHGFNGDGHIGFLNLTNSYYFAFGQDDFNPIAGKRTDIRAHMAAVEASIDRDWLRYRASIFYASGDKDPTDDKATGFDAILDDPNFVGRAVFVLEPAGHPAGLDRGRAGSAEQPFADPSLEQDGRPGQFCKPRASGSSTPGRCRDHADGKGRF